MGRGYHLWEYSQETKPVGIPHVGIPPVRISPVAIPLSEYLVRIPPVRILLSEYLCQNTVVRIPLLRETQLLENVMKDFVKHVNIFLRFDD